MSTPLSGGVFCSRNRSFVASPSPTSVLSFPERLSWPGRADDLRVLAILRTDIRMSLGKSHAQAGHAWTQAVLATLDTPLGRAYAGLNPGTKICLAGGSEGDLERLFVTLVSQGVPVVRIVDSGHVEPPDFDGRPVTTALGVGPLFRQDTPRCLKRLPLLKEDHRMWGPP